MSKQSSVSDRKESFILYRSQMNALTKLKPEDFKKIVLILFEYAAAGTVPDFSNDKQGLLYQTVFDLIAYQIDRDKEKYAKRCEANRQNINARWHSGQNTNVYERIPPNTNATHQEQDKEKKQDKTIKGRKRPVFIPPTVEEVRKYCVERKNQIDPGYFVDHYTARGWKLKGGQAMKDWKAVIRTWEGNNFDNKRQQTYLPNPDNVDVSNCFD